MLSSTRCFFVYFRQKKGRRAAAVVKVGASEGVLEAEGGGRRGGTARERTTNERGRKDKGCAAVYGVLFC